MATKTTGKKPKRQQDLPASRDAAIVRGYFKGRLGTPGYMRHRAGDYAAEGTHDVRENAKRLGVDIRKPKAGLKRVERAGALHEEGERQIVKHKYMTPDEAKAGQAKARRENRGRK